MSRSHAAAYFAESIRDMAAIVADIGARRGATPEDFVTDKHEAVERLYHLADEVEASA